MKQEQYYLGFLIHSKAFAEHDELLTAFTFEQGRVRFLAKGVRKPTSKLRHTLLFPSLVRLRIAEGVFNRIIGAEQIDAGNNNLSANVNNRLLWYWITELILKGMAEHSRSIEIFRLLDEVWTALKTEISIQGLHALCAWFTVRWLAAVGLSIVFPSEDAPCQLATDYSGFVAREFGSADIGLEVCRLLRSFQSASIQEVLRLAASSDAEDLKTGHKIMARLASGLLQSNFKSLSAWI